jgi:hypothetical protein
MTLSSFKSFGSSLSLSKLSPTPLSSGLQWSSYSNQTTYFDDNFDSALSFPSNSTFLQSNNESNTLKKIYYSSNSTSVVGSFGFTDSNHLGLVIFGFFVPNESGIWTFKLGKDDINSFWFDIQEPSLTNVSFKTTYIISGGQNFTTPSLTSGVRYPIKLNWGQGVGGYSLFLNLITPSGVNTDGTNYFYH